MPAGWNIEEDRGGPVEFVIGMRWRQLWRLAVWPWVAVAFARMLRPAPGGAVRTRLAVRTAGPVVVQRWPSRGELHGWARSSARPHVRSWARFKCQAGATEAWGVWHEVRQVS